MRTIAAVSARITSSAPASVPLGVAAWWCLGGLYVAADGVGRECHRMDDEPASGSDGQRHDPVCMRAPPLGRARSPRPTRRREPSRGFAIFFERAVRFLFAPCTREPSERGLRAAPVSGSWPVRWRKSSGQHDDAVGQRGVQRPARTTEGRPQARQRRPRAPPQGRPHRLAHFTRACAEPPRSWVFPVSATSSSTLTGSDSFTLKSPHAGGDRAAAATGVAWRNQTLHAFSHRSGTCTIDTMRGIRTTLTRTITSPRDWSA